MFDSRLAAHLSQGRKRADRYSLRSRQARTVKTAAERCWSAVPLVSGIRIAVALALLESANPTNSGEMMTLVMEKCIVGAAVEQIFANPVDFGQLKSHVVDIQTAAVVPNCWDAAEIADFEQENRLVEAVD